MTLLLTIFDRSGPIPIGLPLRRVQVLAAPLDPCETFVSGKRAFGEERAAIAAVFTTAQSHLRIVFVCFLMGFLFSFYALRVYVWDWMAVMTESRMDPATAAA